MFDLPDEEILPLSKEHVFYTWSAQAKVNPIAVKRARGVYFWDVDDRRYLDFNSMTMCVNIGHGNERVIRAMQEQAAELPYAAPGMTTRVREPTAIRLWSRHRMGMDIPCVEERGSVLIMAW